MNTLPAELTAKSPYAVILPVLLTPNKILTFPSADVMSTFPSFTAS